MRWHPDRCVSLPEVERLQAELIFKQARGATAAHALRLRAHVAPG